MMEAALREMSANAMARIAAAAGLEDLEAMRVDVLGRKGSLADAGKQMGKLQPSERAAVGKLLNEVKQTLESAFDTRKSAFQSAALSARRP